MSSLPDATHANLAANTNNGAELNLLIGPSIGSAQKSAAPLKLLILLNEIQHHIVSVDGSAALLKLDKAP